MIPTDFVAINTISGYEGYNQYFVSKCGYIWSAKRGNSLVKLKDILIKGNKAVWIYDNNRQRKCALVANLVAKAFIPNLTNSKKITYKTSDRMDCSVSNVTWERGRKFKIKKDILMLDDEIIKSFKKLYKAMKLKGYPVPTDTEFINEFLRSSIEDYINKYGLRKILYQMDNK